jgi:hypothetical protein
VEEQLEATTQAAIDGDDVSSGGWREMALRVWEWLSAFHGFREKKNKKLKIKK